MEKCIFCEIVGKRIPAFQVYEDDDFVAFLDVNPLNKGHTLIVPKEHVRWVWEVKKFGDYFKVAKAVAVAAVKVLDAKFVNIVTAGLGVPHAHIHVIPRFENDGHSEVPMPGNVKKVEKEEMVSITENMKNAITLRRRKYAPRKSAAPVKKPKVSDSPEPKKDDGWEYIRREAYSG